MDKESIFIDFQEFLIFTQSNLSLFFMIKYFSPLSSGHGYFSFSFFFFPRSSIIQILIPVYLELIISYGIGDRGQELFFSVQIF